MSENLIEISDPGTDRYSTLSLIPWWNQRRLAEARVLVIGAGALGNEVLKNLALLGVGRLFIADFDVVETSNLSRSVLFRAADAGRRKVDVAAERVRELNPDARVVTFHGDVTRDLGLGVYRRVDVALGCLDNRAARLAVNRACWRAGVPWIDGALDVLMGMVRIFRPPDSACYECGMTDEDYRLMNLRYSCPLIREEDIAAGRLLTTPTSAAFTGAFQAQEAVKLLHGLEVPAGQGFFINGQAYRASLISYARRADCGSHETYDEILSLPEATAQMPAGRLFALVEERLGGPVALLPDQETVQAFYCPTCRAREPVYRPYEAVIPDQVPCRTCAGNRVPGVTSRLAPSPGLSGIPLRQLGIPPLHVVRMEAGGKQAFVELGGDEAACLAGWQET